MDGLSNRFLAGLERGEVDPALLATAGEADPASAVRGFLAALEDRDLGPQRALWAPALLCSARPGFGAHSLAELAARTRGELGRSLDLKSVPWLPRLLASSNFLARLLLREPAWADDLKGELPVPPDDRATPADWGAIRAAKYRGLLRIASRDLAGCPFRESLTTLSDLADRCLTAALEAAARDTGVEAPALLALGKLGDASSISRRTSTCSSSTTRPTDGTPSSTTRTWEGWSATSRASSKHRPKTASPIASISICDPRGEAADSRTRSTRPSRTTSRPASTGSDRC